MPQPFPGQTNMALDLLGADTTRTCMEVGERVGTRQGTKGHPSEIIQGTGGGECDLGIPEGLSFSHARKARRSQACRGSEKQQWQPQPNVYTRPETRLGRPEEFKKKKKKKRAGCWGNGGQREWSGVRSRGGWEPSVGAIESHSPEEGVCCLPSTGLETTKRSRS